MSTSLQSLIIVQLTKLSLSNQQIVQKMGYSESSQDDAIAHLDAILLSENLGLNDAHYDFKYISADFIRALCSILQIPSETYEPLLEALIQQAYEYNYVKLPEVYADIRFNDQYRPSFMLGLALRKFTQVAINPDIRLLDQAIQLESILESIRAHQEQYDGSIPFDGQIMGYRLIFTETEKNQYINANLV